MTKQEFWGSVKAMTYKYKFTCEYTKTTLKPFQEVIEYDHEPTEDELQDDYNDWLSRFVVGGWERDSDGKENDRA